MYEKSDSPVQEQIISEPGKSTSMYNEKSPYRHKNCHIVPENATIFSKPFLLNFVFNDYATAERLAGWISERLSIPGSRDRLEVEVLELPRGGFKVRVAWIGDGQMYEISRRKLAPFRQSRAPSANSCQSGPE